MKLAFMGTPEFALPTLKALVDCDDHDLCMVVTQPDKPRGRGRHLDAPPVKVEAIRYNIPVFQPEVIGEKKIYDSLTQNKPDAVVVVAYGKIIPKDMLYLPRSGFINIHASLLPLYRGAAPINRAIIDGCKTTGISIMQIDPGMDTGPVYMQAQIPIEERDDAIILSQRLAALGAQKIIETLALIGKATLEPKPQDHQRATYAPILKKEEGLINWDRNPASIHNLIRGLVPWPCAFTYVNSRPIKIWEASYLIQNHNVGPGTLIKEGKGIKIACQGGFIIPEKVQPAGKKMMDATAFACGLKNTLYFEG
ncbi:MAG: methionyl-tRNA formyltransferase [Thermodesulfobacteriota bacterium]|nr:methionyl-tRNA formyltransferase [Thermodesulfobacteriota bacterium]